MKNGAMINVKGILTIVCWAAAIVFTLSRVVSQQVKISNYNTELTELQESIDTLTEREEELSAQSDMYSSDEYIERMARTRLGYVRSDEIVFKKAE